MRNADNMTTYSTTTTSTSTSTTIVVPPIIPDYVLWYVRLVVFGIVGQVAAVLGVATNVINIVVYLKLGIDKDPINVSLLGLSISDFASCFTIIFQNLCSTPGFADNPNLPFIPGLISYLFSAWPNALFVSISIIITAFITVERCLCVTYPLKIKQIFTPKRVQVVIGSIFLVVIVPAAIPVYYMARTKWVFYPHLNRTVYSLVFHESRATLEPIIHAVYGLAMSLVCYVVTAISTCVFVLKLRKVAKWRRSVTSMAAGTAAANPNYSSSDDEHSSNLPATTIATATTKSSTNSTSTTKAPPAAAQPQLMSRDAKVARMVAAVAILYLVCYTPVSISSVAILYVPGLNIGGAYRNTAHVIYSFTFLLQSTNASLNAFIYHAMSTNYKTAFQAIFQRAHTHSKGRE